MASDDDKAKGDQGILDEAQERLHFAQDAWRDIYDAALKDVEFKNGDQWPDHIRLKREAEGRPCLTINRLPQFIKQLVGDQRQNRPRINVRPVEGGDVQAAKVREGLIRHIEYASSADSAYDTAFEASVSSSIGFFRIDIDYADFDSFDQDICINRILDQFSVYIDPSYQKADGSDMEWAFVLSWLSRDKFRAQYPGKDPADFKDDRLNEKERAWVRQDDVLVCEYWRKVPDTKELLLLQGGQVMDAKTYAEKQGELMGLAVVARRMVKCHKVESYVLSATEILERATDYPGYFIPIIPVFGEEDNIAGKRILRSLIRFATDPQRMYNYWRTAATEMVALAKSAPWLVTPEQIEGFEDQWESAHSEARTHLLYNSTAAGAPQRDVGPQVPAGFLNESRETADEMKAVIGIYDSALGNRSNETSGKAILARQRESDVSTFTFVDNLNRAISYAGRVVLDLLPHVYNTERVIRILGEDGTSEAVAINQAAPNGARLYDMSVGKYDVVVKTGPSFTTQRVEAASSMMEFAQAVPGAAQLIADLIAKNMDWPGAEEIAERLKTMLPPQLQQEQGLPPQVQAMVGQMQQAMQQVQAQLADAQKKAADEQRKLDIDAYRAETERMKVVQPAMGPEEIQALVLQTLQQLATPADIGGGVQQMPPPEFQQ